MWVFDFTREHHDAARAVAGDRPADRRRDRGAREHRAPPGDGEGPRRAAKEGTDEIGLAVFATTLAVVAVFIPVAFMGGIIGKIFFQFGVTVAFAVLVSLFVSFTLDPMLSSIWADPEVEHAANDGGEHQADAAPRRRTSSAASPSRSTTGSSASPTAIRAGSAGRSAHRLIVARRGGGDHRRSASSSSRGSASPGCPT